ncbi:hypothetical protein [Glutamicibacter sp. HZAU]|uniref:hypothetical protein n=1 Tax=Glutamicibacter sp. HZAU TaxID=2049891 RepID=UPI000FFB7873|nr:hypothetical protein [Glutamicibacter sp. HZAU]RWZ79857.1 hypothetical protein EKH49_15290 [Glutamicibacter sp. HZAU]
MFDGAVAFMSQISTFWMDSPSPDVNNAAVISLREDMSWYVAGFAVLGFFLGLIKLVMSQDVKNSLIGLATPIVNLILAATAYAVGIGVLLTASDEFSKWIVQRSTGGEVDLTQMLPAVSALIASPGTAFLLYILLLLGSIINLLFMYFRDVMFLILSAFIVVLAAASGSEQGRQAWRKANGWLVALLLFKPVAAGIYSLGLRILAPTGTPEGQEPSVPEAMHATLIALLILLLAALALPALIKFIVPAAGVGAGAFSGGAALGAGVTLAAGAAVLAGTGGAAAAGKGAAAMPQGASNTTSTTGTGKSAESAITGSSSAGGDTGTGAGSTGGGSGASETISSGGTGGGASASGTSSGEGSSGTGSSSGGSATGSSTESTGSGSSGAGSTGSGSSTSTAGTSSGSGSSASTGSSSSPSGAGSKSGDAAQASNTGQGTSNSQDTPSVGGPPGAKAPNKLNEAMQKMSDVKGIANGANPSKLVDEDGE